MATEQETKLRDLLTAKPESAKLMAQLSILLTERAKESSNNNDEAVLKEALTLARKSALLCPTRPAGHLALSTSSPHFEERIKSLQTVVTLWNPTCSMTPSALAGALVRLLVEPREEEGRRDDIARTSPKHPSRRELNDEESELYQKLQDTLQLAWSEGQTTESTIYVARIEYRLGLLFRKMLPTDVYRPRSVKHLTSAVEKFPPGHSLVSTARFWLATQADGDSEFAMDRCPKDYVVNLYANFADKFDNLLVDKLSYETPTILRELVDSTDVVNNKKWSSAADLGCGTGLSGLAFRNCVDKLLGVDLSPEMIGKARERDCYETLVVGDVASILGNENEFDLVFACDVFVYIGDLTEVFTAVKWALTPDGVFAFSTEHLEDEGVKHPYVLHSCARFAHKRSYIESLATDNGFDIVKLQICPIRKNGGKDVSGLLAVFKK
jgi:predicted TPR repeat methyltransferase